LIDQVAQQATKKQFFLFGRKAGTEGDESRNYAIHTRKWQNTWT